MSKERIEEMEKWEMSLSEILITNGHEMSEELIKKTRKYRDLLGYAIEQVERVQELEKELEQEYSNHKDLEASLIKQNKRYQEAEKLIHKVHKDNNVPGTQGFASGFLSGLEMAMGIIDEAMEGEE